MRADVAFLLVVTSLLGSPAAIPGQQVATKQQIATLKQQALTQVPKIVRLQLEDAKALLAKRGLSLGEVREVPVEPDSSAGTVVWQDPPAEKMVRRGTVVNVRVVRQPGGGTRLPGAKVGVLKVPQELKQKIAVPPPPVRPRVPNLSGLTVEKATATLLDVKLRLGTSTESASTAEPGRIVGQKPAPGLEVDAGTAVDIVVAVPSQQQASIVVPDFQGLTVAEAGKLADAKRLRLTVAARPAAPAGSVLRVVRQLPAAGTKVRPESRVQVYVRGEAVPAVVPDLTGRRETDVNGILTGAGLGLGGVERRGDTRALGTVIGQKPGGGTQVTRGSAVDIIVVDPQLVQVPSLVKQGFEEARRRCNAAGLQLRARERQPADVQEGTVLSQLPQPGGLVPVGSTISVVVAVARPPVRVTVPNLSGLTLEQATTAIANAGLRLGVARRAASDQPAGHIFNQRPAPETQVNPETVVDVLIAEQRPPAPLVVPDIVGRHESDVSAILQAAGFGVGSVVRRGDVRPRGTVIGQTPVAGAQATRGTSVNIVVVDPQLALVPSLVNRRFEEAKQICSEGGFQLRERERQPASAAAGTILSQLPTAGDHVPLGSTISVVVATPRQLPAAPVTVPDLSGLNLEQATATIANARLRLGDAQRVTSDQPAGRVFAQKPAAGTRVNPDSVVDVLVAEQRPTAPLVVPDIVGRQETDVSAILRDAGFVTGSVTRRSDVRRRGTVIGQAPPGGTQAARGSSVDIVVVDPQLPQVPPKQGGTDTQGPGPTESGNNAGTPTSPTNTTPANTTPTNITGTDGIVVPAVTGLLMADAERVVRSVGLGIELTTELTETDAPRRRIASQTPVAGAHVNRGTLLTVTLAPGTGWPSVPWQLAVGVVALAGAGWMTTRRLFPRFTRPLDVRVTDKSPTCTLDGSGGLVDAEVRFDVRRDDAQCTFESIGAAIVRETRPGEM